ncbi:hypothetical protein [Altererythrobacter sp. Root672]|uniref:hypothetical protein n=1 Tax=Altererythrobacter sp. Root672 TaxID=1736584 RepID=UPI00072AE382|nr:hypothetical protein [Altererythrobacter sp. Root672]KRA84219.1 hypothetical protein ASD76_09605 [Altererythrobacter sp. Root672]
MAGFGQSIEQISLLLNVSPPTLRRYFRHELRVGELEADVRVIHSVYRAATRADRPDMRAAALWLSRRPEWQPRASLGKKALAELDAHDAAIGTEWEHLLQ